MSNCMNQNTETMKTLAQSKCSTEYAPRSLCLNFSLPIFYDNWRFRYISSIHSFSAYLVSKHNTKDTQNTGPSH